MFKNSFLNWTDSFYKIFLNIGNNLQSLFLLYMRVTWGYQFFILGLHQLSSIENMGALFQSLSIPAPAFSAYMVAILETICGFMLFLGLASRIVTIPLICIMFTALGTVHGEEISHFRFLLEPLSLVKQPPYPFLIAAVVVFVFGPGKVSIDGWIKRWAEEHGRY